MKNNTGLESKSRSRRDQKKPSASLQKSLGIKKTNGTDNTATKKDKKIKSKNMIAMKNIEMLPHQIDTVERIVAKCQKQKGMILFHEMGTGKTLTALGILLNYRHEQTVIFCDKTLTYTWQKEMKKIDFENLKQNMDSLHTTSTNNDNKNNKNNDKKVVRTELKNYDKSNLLNNKVLENYDYQDKIVIIDEAHNIAHLLKKINIKKANTLLENFKKCKKIILLSGTPIFETFTDLSVLINIAAGKHIITYNTYEFLNLYMKLDKKTSLMYGHIYPKIVRGIERMMGIVQFYFLPDMGSIANFILGGNQINLFQNFKQGLTSWKNQCNPFKQLTVNANKTETQEKNQNRHQNSARSNSKKMGKQKTLLGYLQNNSLYENLKSMTQYGKNLLSSYFLVYVLSRISKNILNIIDTYGIYNLAEFGSDNTNIVRDLIPYLDFYKSDESFPKRIDITKEVDYNFYQIEEWLRLGYEIDTNDAKRLNEHENNNAHNLQFEPLDYNQYINYGRVIGNLTYNNVPPPKFVALLNFIKENKGQHLIYSNFQHKGSTLLKTFFETHHIPYAFLHPKLNYRAIDKMLEEYKTGKNRILILHHDFVEGISIPGTTFFHILEPVLEFSKYNQIIGRSLRNDSHVHLPPQERFVTIINWRSSAKEFNAQQKKTLIKYKLWTQFFSQVEIQKMEENGFFYNMGTPDQLVYQYTETLLIFKDILQKETFKHKNNVCATGEVDKKCTISTFQKKGNC